MVGLHGTVAYAGCGTVLQANEGQNKSFPLLLDITVRVSAVRAQSIQSMHRYQKGTAPVVILFVPHTHHVYAGTHTYKHHTMAALASLTVEKIWFQEVILFARLGRLNHRAIPVRRKASTPSNASQQNLFYYCYVQMCRKACTVVT